ncbi:AGRE4 protein, partial [Heliornis fulica]|nr:AGRE4 protein [Heliornis fulica]
AGESLHCVSWEVLENRGHWMTGGCTRHGNDTVSICSCSHLSTFTILMAITNPPDIAALRVVTYVGLSVSLLCLFLAIVTFLLCRSLWTVSTALHLQLSICLFA